MEILLEEILAAEFDFLETLGKYQSQWARTD